MRRTALSVLLLVFTGIGLAASAALFVDARRPVPLFCAEGGGCDALRQTAISHPFGVPLPLIGFLGFVVLAALALMGGVTARKVHAVVAACAGLVGIALLVTQGLLHHFCPYCFAVDTSSIVIAGLAVDRLQTAWDFPGGAGAKSVAAFALACAVAGPVGWSGIHKSRLPDVIAREIAQTPPGKVTVVDFVDFECPFCRQEQADLGPLLRAHKDEVRLVRKMVPIPRIHKHALDAAKAACCADILGSGDAMAEALFTTKVDDLTPDGCAKLAVSLGLPEDKYRACVSDPQVDARIARDREDFDHASVRGDGLPLLWIGPKKLMGVQDGTTLTEALDDALARAGS